VLTSLKVILPTAMHELGDRQRWLKYSVAFSMASVMVLTACSRQVEKVEEIRPVRAMKVAAENAEVAAEFAGEVRPRIESKLGFRVGGKIIARKVDLGTEVRRGQVLMQLDPQDLGLAQAQAKAGLSAAESSRDLARTELKRYQDLREKNFVGAAVLDGKEGAYKAAQANYEQAAAAFKNQSNQAGYATLVADVDGVVTAIDAEAGQVVAAGAPVLRIAQAGEMDVVIGIPEDKVGTIRKIKDIRVRMWANPAENIAAKLRELSPIADPVTRTYTAKLALPLTAKDIKLGMTAVVTFVTKNPNAMIKLPMTALFQDKNVTSVWIVDNGTVKLVPVQLADSSGSDVLLASGVSIGQTVVTAGVNLLKPGQKVSILGADPVAGMDTLSATNKAANAGVAK
jgi:multidrug efflux system membrane fusion protein